MASNEELVAFMELDLGVEIINWRPLASEIFKWQDIDLLRPSSIDTILCIIYDWNGRTGALPAKI